MGHGAGANRSLFPAMGAQDISFPNISTAALVAYPNAVTSNGFAADGTAPREKESFNSMKKHSYFPLQSRRITLLDTPAKKQKTA